jgi:UDP-N-acetylglucosamine--N-acetylmuramyl-(pentapeptide) pyrophosphoryl-undecaprenol N-acetylglucosamine transferase
MSAPVILLAAGGTGGHLFPAEALATILVARGYRVHLATDSRGMAYGGNFPAEARHLIRAGTPTKRDPISNFIALARLALGLAQSLGLIIKLRPAVVVGFGGYPSVPPLVAAFLLLRPAYLHEQNGVMGRANRFLARLVRGIGTGFPAPKLTPAAISSRLRHVGNPVRPQVREVAEITYDAPSADGELRVLITGGSQGARILSDVVPQALALLSDTMRKRLVITHQARADDIENARARYAKAGVAAEIAAFFPDLPARIASSHLVIGRAGASTIAELSVIGRPSILIPLAGSLDQDQAANAESLRAIGAAQVIAQRDFRPETLASVLLSFLQDPRHLTDAAKAAKQAAIPDAAQRFADFVLEALSPVRH